MTEYTVGLRLGNRSQALTIEAEDALIAALKVKHNHPEALISYVRKIQSARRSSQSSSKRMTVSYATSVAGLFHFGPAGDVAWRGVHLRDGRRCSARTPSLEQRQSIDSMRRQSLSDQGHSSPW
jgi:hypothetical protein